MIALASLLGVLAAAPPGTTCLPAEPGPGPGVADPFRAPAPKATELYAAGKILYRQGKWEEARGQYRAALDADPSFLAPRLNVACSFVRQERFSEAMAEARGLLAQAYVPWAREILEAADLGALKVRPEMADLRRTMADAAVKWGEGLEESVVFVARQRAPLRVPAAGEGVFILNPHQEVYGFTPATGRSRQLTVEDGHVLLAALTPDRRRLVYVTAEKLVRGSVRADVVLRGITLRELTLATMTVAAPVRVDGDVRRLEIAPAASGVVYRIDGDRGRGLFARGAAGNLVPLPDRTRVGKALAVLTPAGAPPGAALAVGGACPVASRDVVAADGSRSVLVTGRGRAVRKLGERFGAGLNGLPLP